MEHFSFLVTSDTHLGYKEDDRIRDNDSFVAFQEVLSIAVKNNVDFVLLGGDLFHVARPSLLAITICSETINKYSLAHGSKRPTFNIIGGNLSHSDGMMQANFESSSFNVALPIFTIHGNHDEPTASDSQHRTEPLSICQTLATNGLLNYFGKCDSSTEIYVKPIVLKKNNIVLAIYGIGFIPDQRLKALWKDNKVVFEEPPSDSFRILVLHQNRACHDESKHLPDELAPGFFNLIIRGHEHDALEPQYLTETSVVYQPGSTVATSIIRGEAIPKKVAIMKVLKEPTNDSAYKLVPELIKLKSCRSMYVRDLTRSDVEKYISRKTNESNDLTPPMIAQLTKDYAIEIINDTLNQFNNEPTDRTGEFKRPSLPLIRIRIEYKDQSHKFNPIEVSREFYPSRVANKDLILFMKTKFKVRDEKQVNATFESETYNSDIEDDMDIEDLETMDIRQMKNISIDSIIDTYFDDKPKSEQLNLIKTESFTRVIKDLGDRGDVVGKEMDKVKDLIICKFVDSIGGEKDAELNLYDEDQVRSRLMTLLEGQDDMSDMDLYSGDNPK